MRFPVVLLLVLALSWVAREFQHQRIPHPERDTWITSDSDSLYHMRRLERALTEGLPIAGRDAYLNHPDGSAIPWPPYYALTTWTVAAPFAPDDPDERHDWVERRVATLPRLFALLTTLAAALAGRLLAGDAGALIAGSVHAVNLAGVTIGRAGNGDHHAWITLLATALLLLFARALRDGHELSPRAALGWGAAAGVMAGLALGSWVASVLVVIPLQLTLGWLLVVHGRRELPGLAALGLAFHGAAFLVLLPAVLTSPWDATHPWLVVNLTRFHLAYLLCGGLVFVPPLLLRPGRVLRAYPALVAVALALLAVVLFAADLGPARGIREGFTWLGREDEFMGAVWESRGLIGPDAVASPFTILGWGLLLLPFAWLGAARVAFRRGRLELLPWVIAAALLVPQAARQVRFAEALVPSLGVVLAWGIVAAWNAPAVRRRLRAKWLRRPPAVAVALVILLLVGVGHDVSVRQIGYGLRRDASSPGQPERSSVFVAREICEWVRVVTKPGDWSILAVWTWGHTIEWAAERPSVGTNFGTFVGEEGFRAPARFFLTEDPAAAESILAARQSRFVFLTSHLPNQLHHLIPSVSRDLFGRYFEPGDDGRLRFEWYRTLGARLLLDGRVLAPDGTLGPPVDFLRLVYASRYRDQRLRLRPGGEAQPGGFLWEWVPGAVVEAHGEPGDRLEVTLALRYPAGDYELTWSRAAEAGPDGIARLRIPYATEEPNGDGRALGPARWRFAGDEGELRIPEAAVSGRGVLRL